eukprot:TRINITY_DN18176_c0_g1_i1.p1 TRINITY_DN18176_c0_g1~~TRINITY_DN18176_c0_g1_i1.p1  ORF type:complete len:285 (+),score=126.24 TRINITY_DN18176_c0_g1_i1:62-856(+)
MPEPTSPPPFAPPLPPPPPSSSSVAVAAAAAAAGRSARARSPQRAKPGRAHRHSLESLKQENSALQEHLQKLTEAAADYRRRVDVCFTGARERDASLSDRRAAEVHRRALLDGERVYSDSQLAIASAQQQSAEHKIKRLEAAVVAARRELCDVVSRAAVAAAEVKRADVALADLEEDAEAEAELCAAAETAAAETGAVLDAARQELAAAAEERRIAEAEVDLYAAATRHCRRSHARRAAAVRRLCSGVGGASRKAGRLQHAVGA